MAKAVSIKGFKALILSISLKDNHFYFTKETFPHPIDKYPTNDGKHIKLIISLVSKQYIASGLLPVDVCGVWDSDDNTIWSEPQPEYQAKLT